MALIIGSSTTVTGDFSNVQSVSWSVQVSSSRLWVIGSWTPFKTQNSIIESASVTVYAGGGGTTAVTPTTGCSTSTCTKSINVVPAACGVSGGTGIAGQFFVASYSYNKSDPNGFGSESWSLQRWVAGGGPDDLPAPTIVLLGVAEGTASTEVNTGITFNGATVASSQGNVSAGPGSIGTAESTATGLVNRVGGGALISAGDVGTGSASISHTPMYF
jgi:hypothetical protein